MRCACRVPCECASMLCARGAGPRVVGVAALARRPGFGATTLADARVRCDLFGAKMLLVCMRGLRSRAHEPRMIHGAPAPLCAAQLEDASRPDSFYEEKAPAHGGGGGGGGGSGEAKEGEAPKCARARACGRAATLYGRCVWRSLSARLVPTHLIGVCFALPRTTLSARCGARAPVAPAAIAACCGIGPCQYCIVCLQPRFARRTHARTRRAGTCRCLWTRAWTTAGSTSARQLTRHARLRDIR